MTDKQFIQSEIFCDKCAYLFDISRNRGQQTDTITATPDTISSSADTCIDYKSILQKIENNVALTNDELKRIDIKDMITCDYYKKIAKKGEVKKKIIDMVEDMDNSDEKTEAYMVCQNCAHTIPIQPKTHILTYIPTGNTSVYKYINESTYRNRIHLNIMPRTRAFNCPNKKCSVYTNNAQQEAIFFRKTPTAYDTIYVCVNCLTIKV